MNNVIDSSPESFVSPSVLPQIQEKANGLVGLPYLFSRVGYANELTIHLGTERKHSHPKLAEKVRGSHVLCSRGSAWLLRSGVQPVLVLCGISPVPLSGEPKPFNATALESGALIGQRARVEKAIPKVTEMGSVALVLDLSDGSSFTIIPTPPIDDADGEPEPADWELLTPSEWLHVGPGSSARIDP